MREEVCLQASKTENKIILIGNSCSVCLEGGRCDKAVEGVCVQHRRGASRSRSESWRRVWCFKYVHIPLTTILIQVHFQLGWLSITGMKMFDSSTLIWQSKLCSYLNWHLGASNISFLFFLSWRSFDYLCKVSSTSCNPMSLLSKNPPK